jgi:hypothetical protein
MNKPRKTGCSSAILIEELLAVDLGEWYERTRADKMSLLRYGKVLVGEPQGAPMHGVIDNGCAAGSS